MKLANVDTMTDNFISEMGAAYKKHADEELEEQKEGAEERLLTKAPTTKTKTKKKMEESNDEDVLKKNLNSPLRKRMVWKWTPKWATWMMATQISA